MLPQRSTKCTKDNLLLCFLCLFVAVRRALTPTDLISILRHLRFAGALGERMPNHKSAEKRVRQSEKRRVINRSHRSKVRTYIKKLRTALDSSNNQDVQTALPEVMSVIDKSVQKGVLHKNAAARYKSRLTVRANQTTK
jgi:small subunit ribosomal protein S20